MAGEHSELLNMLFEIKGSTESIRETTANLKAETERVRVTLRDVQERQTTLITAMRVHGLINGSSDALPRVIPPRQEKINRESEASNNKMILWSIDKLIWIVGALFAALGALLTYLGLTPSKIIGILEIIRTMP